MPKKDTADQTADQAAAPDPLESLSPAERALALAEQARAEIPSAPSRWTPDQALDPGSNLREIVAALFPGAALVKVRVRWRDPNEPDVILAESFKLEGEIQACYGLPFRVGAYKVNAQGKFIGGSAPMIGYVPAALFDERRFEAIEDDGQA